MNTAGDYRKNISFDIRKKTTESAVERYPDKLPIIVEYDKDFPRDKRIPKQKFLVPGEYRMSEFTYIIRNKLSLDSKTAMFIFVSDLLPRQDDQLSSIYGKHSDPDGFLYVVVSLEHVYG